MPTQPTTAPDSTFGYTPPSTGGSAFAAPTPKTPAAPTPASQPQYTVQQMAGAVRQKYPGAYDKVEDQKLVNAWIQKYPVYRDQVKQTSLIGDIGAAAQAGIGKIGEGMHEADPTGKGGVGGLVTGVGKVLGGAAEVVGSPIAPAMGATVGKAVNAYSDFATSDKNPFLPNGAKGVEDFANSPAGRTTSDIASTVGDYANAAGTVAGMEGVVRAIPSVVDSVKNIKYSSETATPTATEPAPIDTAKISDLYNRAIRPTVSGKSTAAQVTKASKQAISGLQAIADNKPNLEFTNTDGEVIKNATPKTVDQLNQGIGQTKKAIFQQYDALATKAGEKGVTVNGPKIASELDPVIKSKSLALANPQAIDYAKTTQSRYLQAGEITARDAQDVIQHYNDSLKAFYRNPSYDTASKAGIDALIANKLRESLDEGISGATGEQYQALKTRYGALSSMEKDVAHRAVVWARQNKVGLGANLSNIASGAELVKGLLTMNPTDIAVSGAIKGIQKYVQYLNNPDVQIAKIFSHLGKSDRPSTGSTPAPAASGIKGNSSPNPSTSPANAPAAPTSALDKAKGIINTIKKEGNKGFVKVRPKKIPADDLATMSDFTDYHAGSYKPGAAEGQKLELDASRIWEKYFPNKPMPKDNEAMANAFGKHLEKINFGK